MEFKKYPKIHRLGAEENDEILIGRCYIQEKIDGSNTSIWLGDDWYIRTGSRNNDITGGDFNGFNKYVHEHEGIMELLMKNPGYRLYGEWLVRHTVGYSELAYKQWYLFDIWDELTQKFLDIDWVYELAGRHGIKTPKLFAVIQNPTFDELKEYVGKSDLGAGLGEGIVIKNFEFVNKFGDISYAKLVHDKFKEDNAVVFGNNHKENEDYWEQYFCNKFITVERVKKIMDKIQPLISKKLCIEHTGRIIGTVYHDFITEECWEMSKKAKKLNFIILERICSRKISVIYRQILDNNLSINLK